MCLQKELDLLAFLSRLAQEEADKNRRMLSEAIEALSLALRDGTPYQNELLGAVREAARRV